LSYTSFAAFTPNQADLSNPRTLQFFVFGKTTPSVLIPSGGTATYSGIVEGGADVPRLGNNGAISGTSSLTADFGAGTVVLNLHLVANDGADSVIGDYGINAQIASNGFFGSSSYATYVGDVRGDFNGPSADEFGAVWDLLQDDSYGRMQAAGIAVGKKN
jgi:hypothetical protein